MNGAIRNPAIREPLIRPSSGTDGQAGQDRDDHGQLQAGVHDHRGLR